MERLRSELEDVLAAGGGVSPQLNAFAPSFLYGTSPLGRSFDAAGSEAFPGGTLYRLHQTSPDGAIRYTLNLKLYADFPVAEWLPELENIGDRDSLHISDFQSLSAVFPVEPCEFVRLQRNLGSRARHDDYMPEEVLLGSRIRPELVMACTQGRSSADYLPFFGLRLDGKFFYQCAVGWSGAWRCSFDFVETGLRVRCGLGETDFILHPGEKVRQPSFFLVKHAPDCDADDAQNLFRRFMLEHHSPRDSRGNVIPLPFSFACGGAAPGPMLLELLETIRREKMPFELLWMDAGWYGEDRDPGPLSARRAEVGMINDTLGDWHAGRGDWRVDRRIHPDGLRPYADAAARCGMKFMLWFEIERAESGVPVAKAHSEWFLARPDLPEALLLDLRLPEARAWALEQIRARIAEDGVSMVRIDFNFDPVPAWRRADAPDRIGLAETQYITGLYELWDGIRALLPDAAVDNCASGGRRLDFEALSRSFPMWRVDGRHTLESYQLQVSELSKWVPLHSAGLCGVPMEPGDDCTVLSLCGSPPQISCFPDQLARNPAWIRRIGADVLKMRPLFMGDLYHLTDHVWDKRAFHALECLSYDRTCGLVLAFRRALTAGNRLALRLRGIDREADYEVSPRDGEPGILSGEELAALTLDFPTAPGVRLIFFRKV
ncbi:MAG: alpha-galactosidase [Lentisphaeria bacterium]|nr:alpha-galactosidase [Lentisphaeria bacterium]